MPRYLAGKDLAYVVLVHYLVNSFLAICDIPTEICTLFFQCLLPFTIPIFSTSKISFLFKKTFFLKKSSFLPSKKETLETKRLQTLGCFICFLAGRRKITCHLKKRSHNTFHSHCAIKEIQAKYLNKKYECDFQVWKS